MGTTPVRPDARPVRPRLTRAPLLWLGGAVLVGCVGLIVVVRVQERAGETPPSSMFAAAAILVSVIAIVTVAGAARAAGAPRRAAIAFGGGFAAIAVAKFGLGPTAFFAANRDQLINNVGGLTGLDLILLIAIVVGLLYVGAIWTIAVMFRPARPPDGPNGARAFWVLFAAAGVAVAAAFVLSDAAAQYVAFALTGLEATAVAIALFAAAAMVALAFRDTAAQARALGTVSMYVTVLWVALAFVLVFQVLWIVFLLAVVSIWPLRTVTPK